jgi:hypothetical protein
MGKIIDGQYRYSMEDMQCNVCGHFSRELRACRLPKCCCQKEKDEAPRYFPPDGYERRKGARRAVAK